MNNKIALMQVLSQFLGWFTNNVYLCDNYVRKGHRAAYLAITKT